MKPGELKKLHWKIYNYSKKTAESYEDSASKELRRYRADQEYYSGRRTKQVSSEALLNSISDSQVIFLGDFHTFDQNIKNVLRITKYLLKNRKKFKLALEMVSTLHQDYLDSFLQGHVTEKEFLELIEYHDSWRFPWSHYGKIFELAKENKIQVISLNIEGTLSERDEFARDILISEIEDDPQIPILVFYGELHILPNKIPAMMVKKIRDSKKFKYTIVHQNVDQVYWEHQHSSQINGIYQYNPHEFCLISSPPWIKYESMTYWYENLCEDPEFDIHEYILNTGMKTFSAHADDNFLLLCKETMQSLGLPLSVEDVEDFKLYDHRKLEQIELTVEKIKNTAWKNFYFQLIEKNRTFKIPGERSYYCPNYSFNRLIHLVGIHLYHQLRKKNKSGKLSHFPQNNSFRFSGLLLEEFYAFFVSKIFNPHKKCDLYLDLEASLRNIKTSKKIKKRNQLLIRMLDATTEEEIEHILQKRSLYTLYEMAIVMGPLLAENLYQILLKQIKDSDFQGLHNKIFTLSPSPKSILSLKSLVLSNNMYKMQRKRLF